MTVEEENYLKMLPLIRSKMFEQECFRWNKNMAIRNK